MKPLLLGEAPSPSGDRYWMLPLSGRPARTLCEAAAIPPVPGGTTYGRWTWALYDAFDCENLFERYAEARRWRSGAARERAGMFELLDRGVVVCLGRRVQLAVLGHLGVRLDRLRFHDWLRVGDLRFVAVPHPSGLNRFLNERGERRLLGETLRDALWVAATTDGPTLEPWRPFTSQSRFSTTRRAPSC